MAELRTHKFVSALPGILEANAIYFVRVGTGFDIYVTNSSGQIIAYPLNKSEGEAPAFTKGWTRFATGTGSSQNIPIPEAVNASDINVYVNGIRQYPTSDYYISGSNVVITADSGLSIFIQKPDVIVTGGGSGSSPSGVIDGGNAASIPAGNIDGGTA